MPTTTLRASGEVKIPAVMINKYRQRRGDVLEVRDSGNCIVFIPKKVKQKKSKEALFELIERTWVRNRVVDSRALDRVINRAVRTARSEERKRSTANT
jgi:hypothetical protein